MNPRSYSWENLRSTSEEMSDGNPGMSGRIFEGTPGQIHGETPGRIHGGASVKIPGEALRRTAEDTPGRIS